MRTFCKHMSTRCNSHHAIRGSAPPSSIVKEMGEAMLRTYSQILNSQGPEPLAICDTRAPA